MHELQPLADQRDRVFDVLAAHAPWSPRDFVPGISRSNDRQIYAEELTRPIDEPYDLRFVYESETDGPLALFLEKLAWDSEFLGYGVARLDGVFPLEEPNLRLEADYTKPLEKLLEAARQRGVRYLFAVIDPRDLALLRAVGELRFCLIETRYVQHGPITTGPPRERFAIRRACEEDIPHLLKVASGTVNRYDRFHSDPFIKPEDAARLMETWVSESVRGNMADVTIVPDVDAPGAFVSYRYQKEYWDRWGVNLVQGVLSAVSPEFMGWMDRLAPEVNYHLHTVGAEHTFGRTQVTNRAIIWFGQQTGAQFGRCEHIFRILL